MSSCISRGVTSLAILLSLSACGGYYIVDPVFRGQAMPDDKDAETIYEKGKSVINTDSAAYKAAFTSAKSDKAARNSLMSRVLLLSEDICAKHKGDIQATATNLNLTFGTLTTLFSGTAAISSAAAAKSLSAAASMSNASRSLVNEEIYQKAFATAILRAIDLERQAKKAPIDAGMRLSVAEYPIEQGIAQVQAYHQSCSFITGVTAVSKALELRPATKDEVLARASLLQQQFTDNDAKLKASGIDAAVKQQLLNGNATIMQEKIKLDAQLTNAPQ